MTTGKRVEAREKDAARNAEAGETRSGMPNPVDPNTERTDEHKSGYGGEGGGPRTSSDQRQPDPDRK